MGWGPALWTTGFLKFKASLFEDYMIVCISAPINSTRRVLQLINKAGQRSSLQNCKALSFGVTHQKKNLTTARLHASLWCETNLSVGGSGLVVGCSG